MNRIRRKKISELMEQLEVLKDELETIQQEEQEAFDNIPEAFMDTDRYSEAEEAVENLDSAFGSLEECLDCLTAAMGE